MQTTTDNKKYELVSYMIFDGIEIRECFTVQEVKEDKTCLKTK